jgi:long-chain fatty acid transport protein
MRRKSGLWAFSVLILGVMATAPLCYGAGFALYEGSARGNALGAAMIARADDPSALFYNPAGITQLPGFQVMAGFTAVVPSTDVITTFGGASTNTGTESNSWWPPHLYATYQFNDSLYFGLGIFSPFGLGTELEESWPGRYNSYKAVIQTLSINPNVAYKVTDKLSVAGGITAQWFDLKLEKKIDPTRFVGNPNFNNPNISAYDVDSSLSGDSFGYGFNFAAHYKPLDWLALGISYRSTIKQSVDGEAEFTKPTTTPIPPALFSTWFNDTDVSGSINLPDELFIAACFKPFDRLTWEVGGVWTRWSTFDSLSINFDKPIVTLPTVPAVAISQSKTPQEWQDVWRFQTGVEYKALDWLDLRVGFIYDEEPIPDATVDYVVPANNRYVYCGGFGFHWHNWTADISYSYVDITSRQVVARQVDGVLDSKFEDGDANLFGLSISYKF